MLYCSLGGMALKKDILGVRFDDVSRQEAAQLGAVMLEQDQFHYVVTPNPEFILAAEKDADFRQVLNSADLVIPDVIGVVYSAKILGTPLKERVPGIEFAADMLAKLDQMGGRLYLLGAKPGVAQEAGRRILEQHPNIVLCGTHDGYFKDEEAVLLEVPLGPICCLSAWARPSRRSGWPGGAGTQALVWPLAWGAPWMSLPATWSGRPNPGGSWVWSGPTA